MRPICGLAAMLWLPLLLSGETEEQARNAIVATYRKGLDALARGDLEGAHATDTDDWVSITPGQKPRTKQELISLERQDIASLKPPPGWVAFWKPDYEKNGTGTGIQVYDVRFDGDRATVLCLVGRTHSETIDGATHQVWSGSHARDSWVKTRDGWKRQKHEKLTVNERMVDGKAAGSKEGE